MYIYSTYTLTATRQIVETKTGIVKDFVYSAYNNFVIFG